MLSVSRGFAQHMIYYTSETSCSFDVLSISHDGSMVLVYILTWLGYIDGIHGAPYITWILWVLNHAESCWGWCGQPFQPIWLWRFAVVAPWQGCWTTETDSHRHSHMEAIWEHFYTIPEISDPKWSKMIQDLCRLHRLQLLKSSWSQDI